MRITRKNPAPTRATDPAKCPAQNTQAGTHYHRGHGIIIDTFHGGGVDIEVGFHELDARYDAKKKLYLSRDVPGGYETPLALAKAFIAKNRR